MQLYCELTVDEVQNYKNKHYCIRKQSKTALYTSLKYLFLLMLALGSDVTTLSVKSIFDLCTFPLHIWTRKICERTTTSKAVKYFSNCLTWLLTATAVLFDVSVDSVIVVVTAVDVDVRAGVEVDDDVDDEELDAGFAAEAATEPFVEELWDPPCRKGLKGMVINRNQTERTRN